MPVTDVFIAKCEWVPPLFGWSHGSFPSFVDLICGRVGYRRENRHSGAK